MKETLRKNSAKKVYKHSRLDNDCLGCRVESVSDGGNIVKRRISREIFMGQGDPRKFGTEGDKMMFCVLTKKNVQKKRHRDPPKPHNLCGVCIFAMQFGETVHDSTSFYQSTADIKRKCSALVSPLGDTGPKEADMHHRLRSILQ